jgi:glycosyltransferase involved in cell wall biosynthesis
VSAIVPTFNATRFLGTCVASVLAAAEHHGDVEVILVDNGSTDGTWTEVQRMQRDRVHTLQAPGLTVAAVRNRGAERAAGRHLAFIDADCEVPLDYFFAVEKALAGGDWVASGSAYALPAAPHWVERVWHDLHRRSPGHPPKYINAGNLLVTHEAFRRIGGFRESLITGEDADFFVRLASDGLRFREDPSVVAIHHGNPKSLRAFARKQAWHSIGSGQRGISLDLPNVMAAAHLACAAAALGLALWGGGLSVPARVIVAAVGQILVPLLAVCFRVLRGGRLANVPAALLLYHLYFDVRIAVAVAALADRHRAAHILRGSIVAGPARPPG